MYQGDNYYLKITSDNDCDSCITNMIDFKVFIEPSANRITNLTYFEKECGLKYATTSVRLQQRISPEPGVGIGSVTRTYVIKSSCRRKCRNCRSISVFIRGG